MLLPMSLLSNQRSHARNKSNFLPASMKMAWLIILLLPVIVIASVFASATIVGAVDSIYVFLAEQA